MPVLVRKRLVLSLLFLFGMCSVADPALPPKLPLTQTMPSIAPEKAAETNAQARDHILDAITQLIVEYPPVVSGERSFVPNVRGILFFRPSADRTESDISRAFAANLGDSEAHGARGLEFIAQGKPKDAVEELSAAIALDPDSPSGHLGLAWVHLFGEDGAGASVEFDKALKIAPKSPEPLWGKAMVALVLGNQSDFFHNVDAVIVADPNAPVVYAIRGMGNVLSGKPERAAQDYEQIVRLLPQSADGYAGLCTLYNFLDRGNRGLAPCDAAVKLRPDWAPAYTARASTYEDISDMPRAIADATKAIELDPTSAFTYGIRCGALTQSRHYEQGIADCDKADALAPENTITPLARGIALTELGRTQEAIDVLTRAIARFPFMAETYMDRGNAYAQLGKWNEAIADWTSAIGKTPERALLYTGRGAMYLMKSDYANAASDYRRAIEIDPYAADAHGRLGMSLFALGRFRDAKPEFEKRVELDPGSAYAVIWLHLARAKLHETDDQEFQTNAARLQRRRWPIEIVDMLAGKLAPEKLLAMVAQAENGKPGNFSCETDFYTGEFYLTQNRRDEARPLIQTAARLCPGGSAAGIGASAEAKSLN
mgnify:CR=1 FL=1